jgi:hypothetical protein
MGASLQLTPCVASEQTQEDEVLRWRRVVGGETSEMIALVDISRTDAEELVGQLVAVTTSVGTEVRWLLRVCGVYLLHPSRPGQATAPLRPRGEWSLAGRVRWFGQGADNSALLKQDPGLAGLRLYGLYRRVAVKLGVKTSFVRRVARGLSRSKRVSSALESEVKGGSS